MRAVSVGIKIPFSLLKKNDEHGTNQLVLAKV